MVPLWVVDGDSCRRSVGPFTPKRVAGFDGDEERDANDEGDRTADGRDRDA